MNGAKSHDESDNLDNADFYKFHERKEWGFVDLSDVNLEEASSEGPFGKQQTYSNIVRQEIRHIDEKILSSNSSQVGIIKDLMKLKESLLLELDLLSSPQVEDCKICSHCYNSSTFCGKNY